MELDRNMVKEKLREAQGPMMAEFKRMKGDYQVKGRAISVIIDGKEHKTMHYSSGKNNAPVYFDIHGGGFTWGAMEDGDLYCYELKERFGFEVFYLEYTMTPDVEYTEPLECLYDIIHYIWQHSDEFHINPTQMIVGGRSAGGNLAAALCLLAKEKGDFQFILQILDHAWLDLNGVIDHTQRYSGDGALAMDILEGMAIGYATKEQRNEIYCSPLNASLDQLKNLPPAIIQTCELDSLRPDGDLYAERLEQAGVTVIHHCFPKALHGFTEGDNEIGEAGRRWLMDSIQRVGFL